MYEVLAMLFARASAFFAFIWGFESQLEKHWYLCTTCRQTMCEAEGHKRVGSADKSSEASMFMGAPS